MIRTSRIREHPWTLSLAVLVFCWSTPSWAPPLQKAPRPRNVVLITIDTLRADHLGCYGYERATSPVIDKLASQGFRFERAFAQRSVTWPSLASIMTSRYPSGHGVRYNGMPMSPDLTPLAETLSDAGYRCAAFFSPHLKRQLWEGFETREDGPDEAITRRAIEWLGSRGEGPFFLWLHYRGPHVPYAPPEPFRTQFAEPYDGPITGERVWIDALTLQTRTLTEAELRYVVSLYDGEVAAVDHEVGRVLGALDGQGLSEETLVVFTSDHGEDLYEHNRYFYHQASIYDSSLRIPLIMRYPAAIAPGGTSDTLVESIDLAPTILEFLGLDRPQSYQGHVLGALIDGRSENKRPAFAEMDDRIVSIRTERWRFILNPSEYHPQWISERSLTNLKAQPFYKDWLTGEALREKNFNRLYTIGPRELYDLSRDPKEQNNVAESNSAIVTELMGKIALWQRQYGWKTLESSTGMIERYLATIDPATREELEALGYVF